MNFLQNILANAQGGEQDYRDFMNRYEQGPPHEGYSDEEVSSRYQQVSRQVPSDVYLESAKEAFMRMSPQERMQFGQFLQQQSRQQNFNVPDLDRDGPGDRFQDPDYLAQVTNRMHQQQPDVLSQIMSAAMGSFMGGGAASSFTGGGSSNMMNSPVAKAAMAGIAAMAVKKMMQRGR